MNGSQYIWILRGLSLMLTWGTLEGVLLENVALGRKAEQSSSIYTGTAEKAVDGNRDPRYENGFCAHTKKESNPWWRVELQDVYKVTAVMVTNRDKVAERLDNAEIWIGLSLKINDAKNFRCGVIPHIPEGHTVYISCSGLEGRYVTVLLRGAERTLTLCEVEVFHSEDGKVPCPLPPLF
ncbi:fucolectin-like [Notolabrus celidotus]|uniref:fucolectin-like n=1 Tax=Notolabrus celidotus TaxID=1203425 RepID=UPI0014905F3A|nr:fucolectin-like [Notolabrus celidotus]